MLIYRATLRPRSATRSPWQADMLFSHLCWLIRYQEGQAGLAAFLAYYETGTPPLLLSNGFPGEWLPRPLGMAGEARSGQPVDWVSLADFNALRRGEPVTLVAPPSLRYERTIPKNVINRLNFNTSHAEESESRGETLYNVSELAFVDRSGARPAGRTISVYVGVASRVWAGRAGAWLSELARGGYGARKSAGYGQFELLSWAPFNGFDEDPVGANGFISLSNWVPAAADPTRGYYYLLVKYGKLGEEWASTANPFKFPLVMLAAGSAFYDRPPLREWYGRLVGGVAPAAPQAVQYGYALAVPARLAEES